MPKLIELRLSQSSANEEIIKNSVKPCKKALTKAGYKNEILPPLLKTGKSGYNKVQFIIQCKCCLKSWKTLPVFIR